MTIDQRKTREHNRRVKGKPPHKFHETEIPKSTELRCFACNDPIKEIMDVIVLTNISKVRIYHQECGLTKNIEVKPEDIRYSLAKTKQKNDDG